MQAPAAGAIDYGVMIATLLAISLAGERIVAIVKTMFPTWFAEPSAQPGSSVPDRLEDRGRRLRVQAMAFGACWVAAASLSNFDFAGRMEIAGLSLATPIVGFLAMGGSAFWSQVLGISSALKDLKQTEVKAARTEPREKVAPAGSVHLPNTGIAKPAGASV